MSRSRLPSPLGRGVGGEGSRAHRLSSRALPTTLVLALAITLLAAPALAVPPDARLVLAPGTERFLKLKIKLDSVAVDPPGLVQAEAMPSNEVYVTVPAGAAGAGLLVAVGPDRLFVWDLCVSASGKDCPPDTAIVAAKQACPDLAEGSEDGAPVWKATIKDPACLSALRDALAHARVNAAGLRLILEETAAREFYKRVGDAVAKDPLSAPLATSYYGATLRLAGKASRAAVDRALVLAWRETVGQVSYDASKVVFTDPPKPPPGPPLVRILPPDEAKKFLPPPPPDLPSPEPTP